MQRLTLCVIAKNEESMLPGCLASVRGLADAIIVVDTGSTDRTVEIAREHGATVVEHAWSDDFAAARNAALPLVSGGFLLVLDADERLGPGARSTIRKALKRDDFDCGLLPLHDAATLDATPEDIVAGRARRGDPVLLPRLLRRTPDLEWEGIVHEQVTSWAQRHRRIVEVRAPIVHFGAVPSLRESRAKNERNLRLLERRVEREPRNPTARAYLARERERIGDSVGAVREAETAWELLEASNGGERPREDVVLPVSLLGFLHVRENRAQQALGFLERARAWGTLHPNIGLLEGWAHEKLALAASEVQTFANHLGAARAALEECVGLAGHTFVAEMMPGATTFTGQTRLGTVLLLAGDPQLAERAFRSALTASAKHVEARLGLAEALLDGGKAAQALTELQPTLPQGSPDAWLLGAACAQALGSGGDACLFLDRTQEALERQPWIASHREGRRIELETALRPSLVPSVRAHANEVKTATVVIPCYNRLDLLKPVLEGFAREARERDFELIAVDDGSNPPLAALFDSLALPPSFRSIARRANGGRGAALNTGLDHARGDVVILCDSDIIPTPGFVQDHLKFHQQSGDPRATALGQLDWGVDAGLWGGWMGARSNPRLRSGTGEVDWTRWFTDNWSLRRQLLAQGELRFDETFHAWGWEELEFALRLIARGARNTRIEGGRGLHLKPSTCAGMRASYRRSVPNLLHLAARHPERPQVRDWLEMQPSPERLDACERLLDTLWSRAEALEVHGNALLDTRDPLVDWLALAFSDLTFRVGLGRGFLDSGMDSDQRTQADRALTLETAALAARLSALEHSLGEFTKAADTLTLFDRSGLPQLEPACADRIRWEQRRGSVPAAVTAS